MVHVIIARMSIKKAATFAKGYMDFFAGAFYFMLGNLSPRLRSITRGIQLLILVNYMVIVNHGIDNILKPLVKDLLILVRCQLSKSVTECMMIGIRL